MVHRGFLAMLILVLLSYPALWTAGGIVTAAAQGSVAQISGRRIVLDPGHGWHNDPGASANGMREADIVLDVAQRAQQILQGHGAEVALTRTGYEPHVGLDAADDRANAFRPDVVVSIHVNAGGGTGTESCYVVDKPTSAESRRLAALLTAKVSERLDLRIRGNFPENQPGRRCGDASYLYIHWMDAPAALIELAFIDGPLHNDVAKLRDRRQDFAQAIADAVIEYLGAGADTPPSGYIFCAWEDERCNFSGTADVAYGANGTFARRTGVRNGIDCNNGVFGDPLPGVRKACYIRTVNSGQPDYTPPSGYTFCAWEDERCRFGGTADMAYGANGTFVYRTGVRNGIDCNNGVFGDPLPGVRKACYIRQTVAGPAECPGRYRAEYFANRNLSGNPVLVRCEGWPIAHDWGGGSPGSGVPEDGFSARWTGRARIEAGTYTFIARADDGIRVWLDGDLIIDAWRDQPPTEYRVTRNVSAGEHEVRVEYYENGWEAVAEFRWEQAGASASCQGRPLALEQRVEGRLSNATPAVVYCLQGTAGRILSARMFALGNDGLDPYLLILTPDGEVLDENDDGLNIGYNAFLSVQLPEDGVYPIVATRYGDTEGRYALRVNAGFEAAVGDLDRDCDVDNVDRDRLHAALGTADPDADLDLDGVVSVRDAIFQMRSLGIRCR